MDANLAVWRAVSGVRHPAIRICESNSPHDSHRKNWFSYLAQWMVAHNGHRMLTYWNPAKGLHRHGLSGPWPPSSPVVRRLRRLSERHRV